MSKVLPTDEEVFEELWQESVDPGFLDELQKPQKGKLTEKHIGPHSRE